MKRSVRAAAGSIAVLLVLVAYGCGGAVSTPEPPTMIVESSTATVPTTITSSVPSAQLPPTATSGSDAGWIPPTALVGTPRPGAEATLTAAPKLQMGKLSVINSAGEKIDISVEIANSNESRELGLMYRSSMPTDAGMLFDFGGETTGGFWMQNTILPLSIAFFKQDGTIIRISDMEALNTDTVESGGPYYYALETNQGFFRANNIHVGDKFVLPVDTSVLTPGMPAVGK